MNWLNEPRTWKQDNNELTVFADPHTDFWRKTHYGFVRDNGHFYYEKIFGDFEVETDGTVIIEYGVDDGQWIMR